MKMYLAGVSVRRVEDITEALWVCARPTAGAHTIFAATPIKVDAGNSA